MTTLAIVAGGQMTSARRCAPGALVQVRFIGGFLDGRHCCMCAPERRMRMEHAGRMFVYVREGSIVNGIDGLKEDRYISQGCDQ